MNTTPNIAHPRPDDSPTARTDIVTLKRGTGGQNNIRITR